MSTVKLPNEVSSNLSTPTISQSFLFLDGNNESHLSVKYNDNTIVDLCGVSTQVLHSDYETTGNFFSGNCIWFGGDALFNYYTPNSIIATLSVQSFIINGSEKITTPEYITFNTNSTDKIHTWNSSGTVLGYYKKVSSDLTSSDFLVAPCNWITHLDNLGFRHGFKFIGYDYTDRIYFPDVDWSLTIRREVSMTYIIATDYEYTLSYDSLTNTTTFEGGPIGFPKTSIPYTMLETPVKSKYVI